MCSCSGVSSNAVLRPTQQFRELFRRSLLPPQNLPGRLRLPFDELRIRANRQVVIAAPDLVVPTLELVDGLLRQKAVESGVMCPPEQVERRDLVRIESCFAVFVPALEAVPVSIRTFDVRADRTPLAGVGAVHLNNLKAEKRALQLEGR